MPRRERRRFTPQFKARTVELIEPKRQALINAWPRLGRGVASSRPCPHHVAHLKRAGDPRTL